MSFGKNIYDRLAFFQVWLKSLGSLTPVGHFDGLVGVLESKKGQSYGYPHNNRRLSVCYVPCTMLALSHLILTVSQQG